VEEEEEEEEEEKEEKEEEIMGTVRGTTLMKMGKKINCSKFSPGVSGCHIHS
jgi:hypothetical protein